MNEEEVNGLIKWMGTFELEAPRSTIEEISDGAAIAEALAQIAPEWFTVAWRAKIKSDVGANWRLRVSNLKKIVEAVMEYYAEHLNQPLCGYAKPDAAKIGEHGDAEETRRLLQLVLGCAVNCDTKQRYITRIMSAEESLQRVIMRSIQELEGNMHGAKFASLGVDGLKSLETTDTADGGTATANGDGGDTRQRQGLLAELHSAQDSKDRLAQRCHELDARLSLLREEKATLSAENERLRRRLDDSDRGSEENASEENDSSVFYSALRKQVEDLKDEMFKVETSRDDYRHKVETMEKEMSELRSKHEELRRSADRAHDLKDEMDALREIADKAAKYELTIESYKKRMEDMSDLRRQVKILEDKNMEYAASRLTSEEESKRATLARSRLEACKQQLAECRRKLDESCNKCDRLEFEVRKSESRLGSLQRERDRLFAEREALREANEELRCARSRDGEKIGATNSEAVNPDTDRGDDTIGAIDPLASSELEGRALASEREIESSKLGQAGNVAIVDDAERLLTVQALLEDSEERLNASREQNRHANRRILELENKLDEMSESDARTKNEDAIRSRRRIDALREESRKANVEREQLIARIEERDASLQTQKQKVFALQENLTRKELECQALDERYQKYVEKAKSVIKSLNPKRNDSAPSEIAQLRGQLLENRKTIEEMERNRKEANILREMEEKMMTTAYYNLGFACQREAVDRRLSALGTDQGHSFLARQRRPASRKAIDSSYDLEYVQ